MKPCFGIVSYFPWEQPARKERQDRMDRLVSQLSELWPDVPIMVIAQQWKFYKLDGKCRNRVLRYDYGKLGILGARQALRERFLESEFDYLIMFDDDAIIEGSKHLAEMYLAEMGKHPEGFCFIKGSGSSPYTDYNDSQLNLCAISRWIYEREPIPNIDPQKSQAFEDRIWSTLLHFKYADKEFFAPAGLRCTHFKNPNETAPSTWSEEKRFNWRAMRQNTKDIEAYIAENKELPDWELLQGKKADRDGNHYMQLLGNCSCIGYLGSGRIKGPVDNCLTKGVETIKALMDGNYLDRIVDEEPSAFARKPSFEGDMTTGYDYDFVQIIHNNPLEPKYIYQLSERIATFNTFRRLMREKDGFYFVVCFNMYDIDNVTHKADVDRIRGIIECLKEYGVLGNTIFVETREANTPRVANWWSDDIKPIADEYGLKLLTIEDNLIRGPGVEVAHAQFLRKAGEILK